MQRVSRSALRPTSAPCGLRSPRGELLQRAPDLLGPAGELLAAERGEGYPVHGVDVGIPLFHARLQLGEPGHQRHQPGCPPPVGLARTDHQRQRQGLLRLVPAGPAEQRHQVGGTTCIRVEDEPLLPHSSLQRACQYDALRKSAAAYFLPVWV